MLYSWKHITNIKYNTAKYRSNLSQLGVGGNDVLFKQAINTNGIQGLAPALLYHKKHLNRIFNYEKHIGQSNTS